MAKQTHSLLCIAMLLAGCTNPDAAQIEAEMERWLNFDVPSDFEVVDSSSSFAPGDFMVTAEIKFSQKANQIFLAGAKTDTWKTVESGRQLWLQKDRETSGYDYFSISVDNEPNGKVHIQYGNE